MKPEDKVGSSATGLPGTSKKGKVRAWVQNLQDSTHFSHDSAAIELGVTAKDVSNVTRELVKGGGVLRVQDGRTIRWRVNSNAIAAYYAKYPTGVAPKLTVIPELMRIPQPKRRSNRSSLAIAIDTEIKELKDKVKRLEQLRKEFA